VLRGFPLSTPIILSSMAAEHNPLAILHTQTRPLAAGMEEAGTGEWEGSKAQAVKPSQTPHGCSSACPFHRCCSGQNSHIGRTAAACCGGAASIAERHKPICTPARARGEDEAVQVRLVAVHRGTVTGCGLYFRLLKAFRSVLVPGVRVVHLYNLYCSSAWERCANGDGRLFQSTGFTFSDPFARYLSSFV
jgi:hypothetical protein